MCVCVCVCVCVCSLCVNVLTVYDNVGIAQGGLSSCTTCRKTDLT